MSTHKLTQGPVHRALIAMSAPMSFGILAVLSVGVVDAYFLGQLGEGPLAAVGFIYPITAAMASLAIGLSAGANAAVSQSIGRDDDAEHTRRLGVHALGTGVALAVVFAVLVWLIHPWIFGLMGARDSAMPEIAAYMPFWAISFPFLVAMMIVNAVFRAHGNGMLSAVIMVLAAVINIALDPLLIFGWGPVPEMGTGGAALATTIGRATAALAALWYAWHTGMLTLCAKPMKGIVNSLRTIFDVGLPAAFSNAINPAGMAMVTAAVATLGEAAVGGFGAATRVQSLALVPLLALSAGIGPVVGQNWGANKPDRARAAMLQTWLFCIVYGLLLGAILFLSADVLARFIAASEETGTYTAQYLRVVGWSLVGYGILVTTNAAMNARSRALWSMGLSMGRIFALYLPLAWAGVMVFGYWGILLAAVVANLVALVAALYAAWRNGLWSGKIPSRRKLVPALQS